MWQGRTTVAGLEDVVGLLSEESALVLVELAWELLRLQLDVEPFVSFADGEPFA